MPNSSASACPFAVGTTWKNNFKKGGISELRNRQVVYKVDIIDLREKKNKEREGLS
jgi:hypothetical protein